MPRELLPEHGGFALEEMTGIRHTFSDNSEVSWVLEEGTDLCTRKSTFSTWIRVGRCERPGDVMIVVAGGGAYQENDVATVDVVLSVPTIALEGWLVHGEISPISIFGVARSQNAGSRRRSFEGRGGGKLVGERNQWFEELRLRRVRRIGE